jgi:hypothetical protein
MRDNITITACKPLGNRAVLCKETCIKCVNEHDSRGWGFVNPKYEFGSGTGDALFPFRWIASDDDLWGDEQGNRKRSESWYNAAIEEVPVESGSVVCPCECKDSTPGYSYEKYGDLGVVQREPPMWCPYTNEHYPMARFRELADEDTPT